MEYIPADNLKGLLLNEKWAVIDKIEKCVSATGGNFSKSYIVMNKFTGQAAYLKALDYSKAFEKEKQQIDILQGMINAFIYERDILDKCSDKKLDKIVKKFDSGEVNVHPEYPNVNFIIFEMADCELRKHIKLEGDLDYAWLFRSMHNITVGLRQLHQTKIYHQDLKPSNILLFDGKQTTKIGDLGRTVTNNEIESPFKALNFSGDRGYAPFEVLYRSCGTDTASRINSDLFMLGNLLVFYLTGTNITVAVKEDLNVGHLPENWTGNYVEVSGFLYNSLCKVVEIIYNDLEIIDEERDEVKEIILGLCHPDTNKRGYYRRNVSKDLEYLISRFDHIARKLEYSERKPYKIGSKINEQ